MSSKNETSVRGGEVRPALVPKLRFPEFRSTEGWTPVTLQEASTPVTERVGERKLTPVSISAGIGFVPQAEKFGRDISGNQYQLYTLVNDGDFVFNKGNSLKFPQGCVYLLQGWGQVAAPNVFICFRLKDGYSNGFYQQCFEQNQHGRQLKRHITSGARSNGLLNISKETFFGVEILTPCSAEQQKIANCLSSLDELIAAQARKVDALKTHKKGLMQKIFPREGETQPRFRFPEFTTAGHWKEKPFGDLLNGIIDFRGRTPAKLGMEWGGGKISSLSANNVKNGFIDYAAECNWGSEGLYQRWMGGVSLQKDDIVFTMEAPLGKALLLPDSEKYILSQRVVAFKTKPAVKNPFLIQLIWSDGFQRAIDELATGSTAKGINQKALKTVLVKLPEPAEQQHIANCLSSLDTLITAATQKLETLKTHKKGLMQQLFPSPDEATA